MFLERAERECSHHLEKAGKQICHGSGSMSSATALCRCREQVWNAAENFCQRDCNATAAHDTCTVHVLACFPIIGLAGLRIFLSQHSNGCRTGS